MITVERLAELSALGVTLWREGERLRCSAPPGVLTPAITAELRACKDEILHMLDGASSLDRVRDRPIPRAPDAPSYALSPPQRRYAADFGWSPQATWSTVVLQAPCPVRCKPEVFREAFRRVCLRHDSLRTVFPVIDGERRQQIGDDAAWTMQHEPLGAVDAAGVLARASELRRAASAEAWDTERGPLGKLVWLTHDAASTDTIVLWFHRVVMDGTSVKLLVADLVMAVFAIERGAPAPAAASLRYRDFSEWLNGLARDQEFAAARAYWTRELALPLPDPFSFNARAASGPVPTDAALTSREIPAAQVERLRAVASDRGWLFPMMWFAIYTIAMRAAGSGAELVIDASLSGRHRAELRECLGFFTNAAAIRLRLDERQTFAEVVAELTKKFAAAEEHQYFQYNEVVDALEIDRGATLFPLSGLLFNTITFELTFAQRAGGRARWQRLATDARYGIMFYAMFHSDCLSLELTHRLALVDEATAHRILDVCMRLTGRLLERHDDFSVGSILATESANPS